MSVRKRAVCVTRYLISHLVGSDGHLLHSHVIHVARVLFGGSSCSTELNSLRPETGGRVLR